MWCSHCLSNVTAKWSLNASINTVIEGYWLQNWTIFIVMMKFFIVILNMTNCTSYLSCICEGMVRKLNNFFFIYKKGLADTSYMPTLSQVSFWLIKIMKKCVLNTCINHPSVWWLGSWHIYSFGMIYYDIIRITRVHDAQNMKVSPWM